MKNFIKLTSVILILTLLSAVLVSCGKSQDAAGAGGVKKKIIIEITDSEGMTYVTEYDTKLETLRELLEEKHIAEGEEGPYGLYVKVVDGIRADYDKDGAYWAFYKNGEYMSGSVDDEKMEDGAAYQIIYTKG